MSDDPLGQVTIGPREIYDGLLKVVASVDRLTEQIREQGTDLKDHETRLRALEKGRWPLPSLAVLVSIAALGAAIVPLLMK